MNLAEAPASLGVKYDMHGVRLEVRPMVERPLWVQAMYAGTTAAGMIAGLGVGIIVWALALTLGNGMWFLGFIPVLLWWIALTTLAYYDRHQQLERLQIRVGEGWLVIRHRVANLLQDPELDVLELGEDAVVLETERVDLQTCLRCTVVRGPTLVVTRRDGTQVRIPMRSHTLHEIGWLAGAIEQGIRDAGHGTPPIPSALLRLTLDEAE